jgi:hypothetical protein
MAFPEPIICIQSNVTITVIDESGRTQKEVADLLYLCLLGRIKVLDKWQSNWALGLRSNLKLKHVCQLLTWIYVLLTYFCDKVNELLFTWFQAHTRQTQMRKMYLSTASDGNLLNRAIINLLVKILCMDLIASSTLRAWWAENFQALSI